MIVLALILIAVAVTLGFGVAASSADDANLEVFGASLGVTVAGVFFAGAATAATLVLGLWLLKKGMRRGYRRRKEVQELRHQLDTTPTTATEPASQAIAADDPVAYQADASPDPSTQRPTNP
ncbi:hypothetical protein ACGFIF_38135 [Kribbella sp. NPDC049174]|uniref:hypothetical protein n=1 Tax=Kribbella sp. NPDC049174 TaxID=3364112 RepID=UPI0037107E05